nr:pep41 protein [Tellina virus 1]
WEWSDVLWWIKKIAGTIAPIAGAVFPAAAPLTSAISTMANA